MDENGKFLFVGLSFSYKTQRYSDSMIFQVTRDQCKYGLYKQLCNIVKKWIKSVLTWALSFDMVQHTMGKIPKRVQ